MNNGKGICAETSEPLYAVGKSAKNLHASIGKAHCFYSDRLVYLEM